MLSMQEQMESSLRIEVDQEDINTVDREEVVDCHRVREEGCGVHSKCIYSLTFQGM